MGPPHSQQPLAPIRAATNRGPDDKRRIVRGREATLRGEVQAEANRNCSRLALAQKASLLWMNNSPRLSVPCAAKRLDAKIRFLVANPNLVRERSRSVRSNPQATTKATSHPPRSSRTIEARNHSKNVCTKYQPASSQLAAKKREMIQWCDGVPAPACRRRYWLFCVSALATKREICLGNASI
jgi:hypothetical protein